MKQMIQYLPLMLFLAATNGLAQENSTTASRLSFNTPSNEKTRDETESNKLVSIPLKTYTATSRHTETDVQWTPASVTVIDRSELESTFRRTLEDLEGYAPGLVIDPISQSPQGAAIGLRGIQSGSSSSGIEPAVAVTVDGIYIGTHASQNQHLFDFESIEIARGPQGTLTAAPAEAGAIHMTRTKPTGELGLKTRLSAGEFNGNNLDAVMNFPIANGLAGKISIAHQKRDGKDLKNGVSDRRESGIDRTSYALSLLWQANDNWSAQYTIDLDRDESDTPGLLNLSQPSELLCVPDPTNAPNTLANCASNQDLRLPESGNKQRFLQNFSNDREYEADAQTLKIMGEIWNHKITSITGFRSTKETTNQDFDGTSIDAHSSITDSDYDQVSTELRAKGRFSDNLTYIVGGYFFNSEYDLNRGDFFVLDTLTTAGRVATNLSPNQVRRVASTQESTTLSVFGQLNYRWDEQWDFDLGLKLSTFEKDFDHTILGLQGALSAIPNTQVFGDKEFDKTAGDAGFSYKVDESAMVYGRYSVDHTPGGFNDRALSAEAANPYDSSTTQGIELGLKSHWLDDRLRLNMAFYNNYQDDKVQFYANRLSTGAIEFTYDNISEVEVRGFDLEFEFAATDQLYFRGSWGHLNSDYTRFEVPDLANTGTVLDLTREPERSPDNTLYVNGQYSIPFRSGTIGIFAGYQYFDEYRSNSDLAIGTVRTYSTWDASIEYVWQDYTVRLFSQNLNDKRFILNVDQTFDAEFTSLPGAFLGTQSIATTADVNRPRYTGIEFVWQPQL